MKFADLCHEAVLWTCYLENFPAPERFLNIYSLTKREITLFDNLGKFFPFDEFYTRDGCCNTGRGIKELSSSRKRLILPWIYWPKGHRDILSGKTLIHPPSEMFTILDNKIEAKNIFTKLGIPTPKWSFISNGRRMLEKPIQNSAGGLNISLTNSNPKGGYFLEEYIPGHRSIGLQFFVYDEVELLCADEMLFHSDGQQTFTFHAQKNIQQDELPDGLIESCLKLGEYLSGKGYKGLFGIDALIGDGGHYLLEINPRGIAFLPAFFAASALGWTSFETYMSKSNTEQGEFVLLDFGSRKKVIRQL